MEFVLASIVLVVGLMCIQQRHYKREDTIARKRMELNKLLLEGQQVLDSA